MWTAIVGALVSMGLLLIIFRYQPSPIPAVRATERGKLDPGLFGAFVACLETALAIAAISLIFETLLRESYATALRRYLRLSATLVRSGLQDIRRDPELDWKAIIEPASTITALVRDPSQWLIPSLSHIIVAAQKRTVTVTIGLPDTDSPQLKAIADTIGLSGPALTANVQTALKTIENQWQAQKTHLKPGSTIRVVAYDGIPLTELLTADDVTVCLICQALQHPVGEWQIATVFDQRQDQYPSDVLRRPLADLSALNELWAG
jgi:hypothetical protein